MLKIKKCKSKLLVHMLPGSHPQIALESLELLNDIKNLNIASFIHETRTQ